MSGSGLQYIMPILYYGLLRLFLLENWQLRFIFDGFHPPKLFNIDVRRETPVIFLGSRTLRLTFPVDVVDTF